MENAAVKIRFIDKGDGLSTSELSILIFRRCGGVDCIYASKIEPCFHFSWIPYLK